MLIFTYGTLMRGFYNNRILLAQGVGPGMKPATFVGPAVTRGKFYMRDVGFPYIKHQSRAGDKQAHQPVPVIGEVWDIGDPNKDPAAKAMLDMLDRLEGVAPADAPKGAGHYERLEHLVYIRGDGETDDANPRKVWLYHATRKTWERAAHAPDVKDCDWGKRNKARRRPADETGKTG